MSFFKNFNENHIIILLIVFIILFFVEIVFPEKKSTIPDSKYQINFPEGAEYIHIMAIDSDGNKILLPIIESN